MFFITIGVAHSAITTQTYMERKTAVAGTGMATAGQIAKYVADDATGEMKLTGADLATVATSGSYTDLSGTPGLLGVADILTGTDTAGKTVSAQTVNAAMGGYTTTAGTSSAFTATIPGFVLQDGARVRLKMHSTNGATPTLNINGTGAKSMLGRSSGQPMPSQYIMPNSIAEFVYDSGANGYLIVTTPTPTTIGVNGIRGSDTSNYYTYPGAVIKAAMMSYAGAAVTTAGTASAYTITDATNYTTVASFFDAGTKVVVKMHATNAAGATLNLNALGAKDIFYKGAAITAGLLQTGGIYSFVYDGTNWNIVMSPNAGTIPLPTAECLDSDKSCVLRFGKLTPAAGPGQSGTGTEGYYWEVVER